MQERKKVKKYIPLYNFVTNFVYIEYNTQTEFPLNFKKKLQGNQQKIMKFQGKLSKYLCLLQGVRLQLYLATVHTFFKLNFLISLYVDITVL